MILVVNAGSSSLRLAAYRTEPGLQRLAAEHLDTPATPDAAVFESFVGRHGLTDVDCVIHRVVHGGDRFDRPVAIDAEVEREIERLCALAPLHNPIALAWIHAARDFIDPGTLEVAAFDTAFYADLPEVAKSYALPEALCRKHGIRRYGFHGLAHQSMLESWVAGGGARGARIVSMQLGSGCSITASRGSRPLDTSMGFSPLEGLMMATRSGDVDPAAVLHLVEQGAFTPRALLELLNRGSGLLGVSGVSSSMSTLVDSREPAAEHAVALFCHRLRKHLGGCLAVLGGVDAVLLGGGIGENSAAIRSRVLDGFGWAGIELDPQANEQLTPAGGAIHAGAVAVWVTPVDEMIMMARSARALLDSG